MHCEARSAEMFGLDVLQGTPRCFLTRREKLFLRQSITVLTAAQLGQTNAAPPRHLQEAVRSCNLSQFGATTYEMSLKCHVPETGELGV